MRCHLIVLALVAVSAVISAAADASGLDEAQRAYRAGEYDAALEALDDAADEQRQAAALMRAGVLRDTGHLADGVEILRAETRGRRATPESRAAYGAYLVEHGDWEEAIEILDPAAEGVDEPYPPARYWRALALSSQGRRSRARLELEDFIRDYNRGRARSAEELLYVALACHQLELFADASDAFRQALEVDPESIDIRLHWARLFMQKYRPDEAVALLDEITERNPRHAEALAMRAAAELDLTYDLVEARRLADAALQINARQPDALEVLASLALDDRDYATALALTERVVDDWPKRLESISLDGAIAWLRDDPVEFAAIEARALAIDARPAAFYHTVGTLAERNFRYAEALELYQKSIEADAGFWPAFVSLGVAHSRAGDDGRALQFLQRAFEADPFNVQAYNMVELWETTLTDYRYVDDEAIEGLRYRFHRDELEVLRRYIPSAIRGAYATYAQRYGFEPETPVSIEVFADQATFGIRSIGLPMAPQHGICFGHVVTSRSPREGNFNWRQVLEHELSHVFSLQASNYRVPRWFTEGLAEYDTILSREEWRREEDLAMVQALQRDELIGVLGLNRAFVSTERPEQVLEAYFQASLVVEFIGERWGYPALMEMLAGWRESLETPAVVQRALGVSIEELDELFEESLRRRYAPLLGILEPALWWYDDYESFSEAVAEHPDDPHNIAELAWAEVAAGDLGAAYQAIERALALDAREPLANLLAGHLAFQEQRLPDAARYYQAVVEAGADSFTALASLGRLAQREGNDPDAQRFFDRAAALYPRDADVHRELATLYGTSGDPAAATEHLVLVAMLDQHDADTTLRLANAFDASGMPQQAREFAEMAANIDPFHPDLHGLYGRLAHAAGDWTVARRELELELAAGPADRSASLRRLLDVYEALGLSEEAATVRRELAE